MVSSLFGRNRREPCPSCRGRGFRESLEYREGGGYVESRTKCWSCGGRGDILAISKKDRAGFDSVMDMLDKPSVEPPNED